MPYRAPYLRTLKNVRNADFEALLCSIVLFLYLISVANVAANSFDDIRLLQNCT